MRPFFFKYNPDSYLKSGVIDTGAEILKINQKI
jgi:hypothetical protein